ncbi:hypothetical protein [Methylotuvimicrobium alcaliphilum]|uniref:Uncharacterized protein n=1 Tax=Methylotuvimicrobium alcaliphilum (strain DSM 19304 / NCIMB 14124 / VKM B-2133 / 20Z) TaxID=1091494 RepID=G4T396_META2|nr:hypothetical protein [Methylotuvimicrobium alcaliphilum]CCE22588.1 conserved exported protein of unknown function [Methylotuvimicrobium alcaliphilum 20Z]
MTTTSIRAKCALTLILIAIASIGPIPITSTLGAFVALFRPRWFKTLVDNIYGSNSQYPKLRNAMNVHTPPPKPKHRETTNTNASSFKTRLLLFLAMLVLIAIDIGPIPTASLIALFAVIFRPRWFLELFEQIYRGKT